MDAILHHLRQERQAALDQLLDFLRLPSVSAEGPGPEMAACAGRTAELMRWAGLTKVTIHQTGGHPAVIGSWRHAPGRPTVLIYGHYDVQPTDPRDQWARDPFDPWIDGDRLVARGAADDKGQVFMHLRAIEAILMVTGRLPVNVVVLIEGEEEIGSAHLPGLLDRLRDELRADVALISDTAMWAEGQPAITVTLRGLLLFELILSGPNRDLHSGAFGGAVANPLEAMARLLAGVKDGQGQVRIPGFYDAVRPASAKSVLKVDQLPWDESAFLSDLGVSESVGEKGFGILERLWLRPTFEINGLSGGFDGPGSKTVLPAEARAKLSLRLAPDQNPEQIAALVERYFLANIPPGTSLQVRRMPGGAAPMDLPVDAPFIRAARRALSESFGKPPLLVGEGGSIPVVSQLLEILELPTLMVGFSLPDSNAHGPNENLHLPTFFSGMESLVRLYHYLGQDLGLGR